MTLEAQTFQPAEAVTEEDLLKEISEYCKRHRMAETTFGRRAVNDGKLVSRLRQGGKVTAQTVRRVRTFVEGHSAPAGPLADRPPEETIARLIRRADRYAARLSPRRSRPASSPTAAAQVALLDEGGHTDEAGQALIRTLGL